MSISNWLKSKFKLNPDKNPHAGIVKDYIYMGDGVVEEIWVTREQYDKNNIDRIMKRPEIRR